ncbi:hypothetical protein D3H35_07625 [Cohnella faecalis]|uniref:Uncharacterized protein n=1 Tax=Cohnella faecalis TaxID=2315694 RepID=A0A398CPJ9_9BACL|nr:hypothetical protein D3H35_07625 [Cohnella faecalis]
MRTKDRIPFLQLLVIIAPSRLFLDLKLPWKGAAKNQAARVRTSSPCFFPTDSYPETAHIKGRRSAQRIGHGCNDRIANGSRRAPERVLKGIHKRKADDARRVPMACARKALGCGHQVDRPLRTTRAGSWASNQVGGLPDGTRLSFVFRSRAHVGRIERM